MAEPSIPPGFDFTDPDLYANRVPADELAELRRTAPVWWNPQPKGIAGFGDDGYWVVSKHAEVKEASRNGRLFSTSENTAMRCMNRNGSRIPSLETLCGKKTCASHLR